MGDPGTDRGTILAKISDEYIVERRLSLEAWSKRAERRDKNERRRARIMLVLSTEQAKLRLTPTAHLDDGDEDSDDILIQCKDALDQFGRNTQGAALLARRLRVGGLREAETHLRK